MQEAIHIHGPPQYSKAMAGADSLFKEVDEAERQSSEKALLKPSESYIFVL